MSVWHITEQDRDAQGRIRTLADLLPPSPTEAAARAAWRPSRMELAGLVGGLVLAAALIVALNTFWPAPDAPPQTTVTIRPSAGHVPPTAPLAPLAAQDAYDAPGGAILGTIPTTTTIAYQDSAHPGWGGVAWDGGIVWVKTGDALEETQDVASLPDLAPRQQAPPPPDRPAPPAAAEVPYVEAAPAEPTPDTTHARPHDETRPLRSALPMPARAPGRACWPGPPAPNPDDAPRCWAGVPFVVP